MSGAMLEAGLDLAGRFGPIFPQGPDKRPRTTNGSKDATRDPAQIRERARRCRDAVWTLLTGEPSGIVALDIDIKPGRNGLDTLEELGLSVHPRTPTAHTPSGGLHCLFAYPGRFVKTSADKIGPGLEVKGDNGWITLPPGPGRSWDPHLGLDVPLAPMPDWMVIAEPEVQCQPSPRPRSDIKLTRYGEAALDNAVKRIIQAPAGAQEVSLNSEAFTIGQLAAGGAIPPGLALDSLLWAARRMPSGDPRRPWRPVELERKVRAAFTDGLREPRGVPGARR
jgi:putative DNA primase/helicase